MRNEAAERLRKWINAHAILDYAPRDLNEALATERRNTVERIRAEVIDREPTAYERRTYYLHAVDPLARTANHLEWQGHKLLAILDEVAGEAVAS